MNSWIPYALLSALFAALTAIFAKVGIRGVDSDLATTVRTVVILVLAWGIALGHCAGAGRPGRGAHSGRHRRTGVVLMLGNSGSAPTLRRF